MGTLNDFYVQAAALSARNRRWAVGAGYQLYERTQLFGYALADAKAQILSVPQYANALSAAGLTATFNAVDFGGGALPAPTFVAAGTDAVGATTDASLIPGMPAGVANNDIGLLVVSDGSNQVVTIPAGWTQVVSLTNGATRQLVVAWRRLLATDTAPTVSKTAGAVWTAKVLAYRGVRTAGDPWGVAPITDFGTGTAIATSSLTPLSAQNRIVLVIGRSGGATNAITAYSTTNPGALTEDEQIAAAQGQAVASAAQGAAAATGSATAAQSSAQAWTTALIALVPG